jgi:hypothetical protein
MNAVVYSHPLYSTIFGVLGKQIVPLLANCTFIKSGIRLFDVPRFIGTSEIADLMITVTRPLPRSSKATEEPKFTGPLRI